MRYIEVEKISCSSYPANIHLASFQVSFASVARVSIHRLPVRGETYEPLELELGGLSSREPKLDGSEGSLEQQLPHVDAAQ